MIWYESTYPDPYDNTRVRKLTTHNTDGKAVFQHSRKIANITKMVITVTMYKGFYYPQKLKTYTIYPN